MHSVFLLTCDLNNNLKEIEDPYGIEYKMGMKCKQGRRERETFIVVGLRCGLGLISKREKKYYKLV